MTPERTRGEDDLRLLGELRDAFSRAEPPPRSVVAAAKAAYALRALDAELALLIWDSEVDAPLATVRGPVGVDDPRSMTFEVDALAVEVEVGPVASGRPMLGQLVPPEGARVLLVRSDGEPGVLQADELGRFAVDALPPGPLRLRVERPGRAPVVTSWVLVD
jgi:hypothetical protein